MFAVTDPACRELDAFFGDKEKSTIRVCLVPGGCSGPRLALALDEPGSGDKVFEEKGYSFCINEELLGALKAVTVDFSDMGFSVDSEVTFGGGCASCSSSCDQEQ